MVNIASEQLHEILSNLGELLETAGEPHHLIVIGGSGLVAINVISRATRDVDVMAIEKNGKLVSASPLPSVIATAAATIAQNLQLEPDWLNAGPTGILDFELPAGFMDRLTRRAYGSMLRVSFASRIDQISFKLDAFIDRGEPRDFSDLQQLAPTPAELRDAARWARTHIAPGPYDDAIAQLLDAFGVEDEGRDA